MNAIDILQDLAHRPVEALDNFWDELEPAQLNRHPGGHDNSAAWLLWHTGREIDVQLAHLANREQAWTAQGFAERFGLDVADDDIGYGHTPEQARAIAVPETEAAKALLRDYLETVTGQARDYLGGLTDGDLDEVVDSSYDPPVTRGARLVSAFEDALQHVGQVGYITGTDD